jgi:ABC-type Zn uptake system ZnuABC Zn-binding protein ZnuA
MRTAGPPVPRFHWRSTLIVLGSVVLFGAIVRSVGVALSTVILIVTASAASHEFRPRESLIVGIVLAALAVGVFVVGLQLQLPIWPGQD